MANYRDNEGGKLYGNRWPTTGIMKVATYTVIKVANYTDNDGSQLPYCPVYKPRLSGANIPHRDNEGGQLYGYGRWQIIRIMKVAYYTDNDGVQLYGHGRCPTIGIMNGANYRDMEGGQLYGYGKWPTIGIMKVANCTDNEGGQLYG